MLLRDGTCSMPRIVIIVPLFLVVLHKMSHLLHSGVPGQVLKGTPCAGNACSTGVLGFRARALPGTPHMVSDPPLTMSA